MSDQNDASRTAASDSGEPSSEHPTVVTPVPDEHPTAVTPVPSEHPTAVTPVPDEHPTAVTPAGESATTVEPAAGPVAPPPAPDYPMPAPPVLAPPVLPYQQAPAAGYGAQHPAGPYAGPNAAAGYPGGYAAPPVPQTSNNAVVALVLAILSWAVCPIVLAVIALVFASKASKEIGISNGWLTGSGLVLSARIIAWLNIALVGLLFVIMFAIGVWGAASGVFEPSTYDVYTPEPTSSWGT